MSGAVRGGRGHGVLAMLAFGAVALLSIALAGQCRAPAQVRVAKITSVQLTDDDGEHALFNSHDLAPGRSAVRCLRVDYAGPAGAGPVRLLASDVHGSLVPHLTVRVAVGTGGGFAGCDGFSGAVLYAGTISGLAGGTPAAPGVPTGWEPEPGSGRTFQLTVSVDSGAGQGQSATGTFQWVFLDDVPEPSAPPKAGGNSPDPPHPAAAPATKPAHVVPPATPPATPRAAPRTGTKHSGKKRSGLAAVVSSAQQVAERAKRLIGDSVVVGTRVVKHGGFPIGWLVVLGFFLIVQNRIDRRDPKLALAPVWREPDLAFPDTAFHDSGTAPDAPEEGGAR
jgi:hypothetical protein